MKLTTKTTPRATAALFAALAFSVSASAANVTWVGTTNATWTTKTNWSDTVNGTTNPDTAVFTGTPSRTNITVAANSITGINFSNTTSGQSFTISSAVPGTSTLTLRPTGFVTTADVSSGSITDVINTNLIFIRTSATVVDTKLFTIGANHDLTVNGSITENNATAGNSTTQNLTKAGAGTLFLNGSTSYSGTTTVSAGTLSLGSANTLFDSSLLSIASTAKLDLNFSGIEVISGLTIAGSTVSNGTYDATALALLGLGGSFTGAGSLQVGASAIPEPSTYAALAGLGILGFAASRRRRSAA
jgi:fibronectin-binding autotransporter adhesin